MTVPARGVLQTRSADEEHVIAVYNPLVLTYFSRAPTDKELALLRALTEEARAAEIRGGMLFVVARRNAAGGIDPRVRKFFEEMVQKNASIAGATAAVIAMQGFGGSLMRSFLTSLLLLTRKRGLLQVFGAVDAACRWLAPLHELEAATLMQVYEQATAKIVR